MIEIIDLLKPKNGGSFKLIEDIDIAVQGYTSLADAVSHFVTTESIQQIINAALSGKQDKLTTEQLAAVNSGITAQLVAQIGTNTTAIAGKASQADLTALEAEVNSKADDSDIASLQAQIDNIVSGSTEDSEVINARVGADGTSYSTLKQRIDTEVTKLHKEVKPLKKGVDVDNIGFAYTSKQIFDRTKATDHGYYNALGTYVANADLSGYMVWCKDYDSLYFVDTAQYWISFHEEDGTFISAATPVERNTAISIPNDAVYVCINVATTLLGVAEVYKYGIKEKSGYQRYLDATIEKYEKYVGCIVHGNNLFNKAKTTPNFKFTYNTGAYGADTNGYAASEYIEVESSTVYSLNVIAHICYWDANKKYISGELNGNSFATHTTPATAKYVTISVQNVDGCMFAKGSTELDYEPYTESLAYGENVAGEVHQARVGTDGTTYTSLEDRLDSEIKVLQKDVSPLQKGINVDNIEFAYSGKQIFDKGKATEHGYYNDYGIYTPNSGLSGYMVWCKDFGSLYFLNTASYYISFHTQNGAWISSANPVDLNTEITVPNNAAYVCINVPNAKLDDATVYKYGVPAEDGYQRYLDVTIEKYEKHADSITHGNNLFNKAKVTTDHLYHYSNGTYRADSNGYAASEYIPVKANTAYGLNVVAHMCYWDSNKKFISGEINGGSYTVHTTPANTAYLTISVQNLNGCMLSEGSTEKEYEPYIESLTYGVNNNYKLPYRIGYIYHTFNVPKTKDFTSETFENTAYLKLPSTYDPAGAATKLCILCHGASKGISSSDTTDWTHNTGYNNIVDALNAAGYAVIDSNGYNDSASSGHEHWGAPQALAGYLKAYEYFTEKYNLEKTVYMYGFSMGGLTALNLAINRSFSIKCMMIAAPVISLYDQCVSGTAQSVNNDFLLAYGMSEYSAAKCRGYDRYNDIISLDSTDYIFKFIPPIYCAYGDSDTAISNQKIHDYFNALHNSNYDARIKEYTGGHDISYGNSQDVIIDMIKFFNYY